jgi:pectin methylesterase-like acyl-CoA thioesterase
MTVKLVRAYDPAIGDFMVSSGEDSLSVTLNGKKYATIQAAMTAIAAAGQIIKVGPGTYSEDVTWTKYKECILAAEIPGTVVIAAVTAFALKMDPALTDAKTWSATTIGIELSHATGLVGLQVDNATVGARMKISLIGMDIESQTSTDHAIDVNRTGTAAIRIYANGHGNTIEGLVHVILESSDDRVRFTGYRLIGGITLTGEIANAEITLENCGILTNGRAFPAAATHNLIGCWTETDANPNVYTAVTDEVAQTATT